MPTLLTCGKIMKTLVGGEKDPGGKNKEKKMFLEEIWKSLITSGSLNFD